MLRPCGAPAVAGSQQGTCVRPTYRDRRQRNAKAFQAAQGQHDYPTIEACVGSTPLVRLQRLGTGFSSNTLLLKLEGNNPAGSVKDRPALSMIVEAEKTGRIKPGDTIIEATSGNTGIALAMAAAIKGYKMKLIMPRKMTAERAASMAAYGAELIWVDEGMEEARDLATALQARGEGIVLDQFANPDNPLAHLRTTGPELWAQTRGKITHFVSSMGTTGTIMGVSAYLKAMNPDVQIVGLQPKEGSAIAGIRRWPKAYLPSIFQEWRVDKVMEISQREAEQTMRVLARTEGIMAGVSSGGAVAAALRLSAQVENAVIAVIICDRGDRYLSTGLFNPEAAVRDPQPCTVEEFWSSAQCLTVGYPGPHFVLFTASPDPVTGQPWCSDCASVLGRARQAVAKKGGTLLEVHVGSQGEWEDPAHPLRTHKKLMLRYLPALMLWSPDGCAPSRRAAGDWDVLNGLIDATPANPSKPAAFTNNGSSRSNGSPPPSTAGVQARGGSPASPSSPSRTGASPPRSGSRTQRGSSPTAQANGNAARPASPPVVGVSGARMSPSQQPVSSNASVGHPQHTAAGYPQPVQPGSPSRSSAPQPQSVGQQPQAASPQGGQAAGLRGSEGPAQSSAVEGQVQGGRQGVSASEWGRQVDEPPLGEPGLN